MVIVALVLAVLTYYLMNYTNLGLKLQAVGENPAAADAAGVSVEKVRLFGAVFAGALAGLAGAYLSIDWLATITRELAGGARASSPWPPSSSADLIRCWPSWAASSSAFSTAWPCSSRRAGN